LGGKEKNFGPGLDLLGVEQQLSDTLTQWCAAWLAHFHHLIAFGPEAGGQSRR
jgi:hypothetical protein